MKHTGHWIKLGNQVYKTKRYQRPCFDLNCSGCLYCADFDFTTLSEKFYMWCFQHSGQKNHRRFRRTIWKNDVSGPDLKMKISIPTTWPQDQNADFFFSLGQCYVVGKIDIVMSVINSLEKEHILFNNFLSIEDIFVSQLFFWGIYEKPKQKKQKKKQM